MSAVSRRDLFRTGAGAAAGLALPTYAAAAPADAHPLPVILAAMNASMPEGYQLRAMLWTDGEDGWFHHAMAAPCGTDPGQGIYFDAKTMQWEGRK